MKTPYAILIGLSLIAAAIFFKDTAVKPAHAFNGPNGFACYDTFRCWVFEGDKATMFSPTTGISRATEPFNWRTGKQIN